MLGPEYDSIEHAIVGGNHALDELLRRIEPRTILDLGCGNGGAVDYFSRILPDSSYTGVDIETSPEVNSRTRRDATFVSYNGTDLPFEDRSFDLVYSNQVFEHIRHPDQVASEVFRVLRPGGKFVGSLSYLEPYHSFSIFNFTPYGVSRLIEDNGMQLELLAPGPDGLSMMVRQLTLRRISRLPFIYPMIDLLGYAARWSAKERIYVKLRFAGQLTFVASRPNRS